MGSEVGILRSTITDNQKSNEMCIFSVNQHYQNEFFKSFLQIQYNCYGEVINFALRTISYSPMQRNQQIFTVGLTQQHVMSNKCKFNGNK